MILGLLSALIVSSINIPLSRFLVSRVKSPGRFLLTYLPLGLVSLPLGFALLSSFLFFRAETYWLVGLLTYGSVGGSGFKELRRSNIVG